MPQTVKSTLVLAGLCLALVAAAFWGWSAATRPFPGKTDPPKCVSTTVEEGEKVFPQQVTVSVLNASQRNGLAGVTLQAFADESFGEGDTGNAPDDADVAVAAIWTSAPDNPDVRLVASRLGPGTRTVDRDSDLVGVTVVVGDEFQDLRKGKRSVRATADTEICSPPVS